MKNKKTCSVPAGLDDNYYEIMPFPMYSWCARDYATFYMLAAQAIKIIADSISAYEKAPEETYKWEFLLCRTHSSSYQQKNSEEKDNYIKEYLENYNRYAARLNFKFKTLIHESYGHEAGVVFWDCVPVTDIIKTDIRIFLTIKIIVTMLCK
jgi:hypothetical protein